MTVAAPCRKHVAAHALRSRRMLEYMRLGASGSPAVAAMLPHWLARRLLSSPAARQPADATRA
eukprot:CAMPEP_0168389622 /NCGR_PEP_ID=MMETSP0228-20121227/17056_1 /TAXON_ID=133427 /ORGANISM="Protoceratium reticulatum, Strain CCCM 535 (=CCMP 1889)" /LENGTH=62 /DNA_ID=CAMNT_0008402895 /DNA_START=148 /DNA_END=333 /DNA_ORIENTATION=-